MIFGLVYVSKCEHHFWVHIIQISLSFALIKHISFFETVKQVQGRIIHDFGNNSKDIDLS